MTHEEKCKLFESKNGRQAFLTKTSEDELPIIYRLGSSSHNPEQRVGIETCDLVLWVKFLNKWFRPYGGFTQPQIRQMVEICINDNQILSLFEILSCES